MARLKKTAGKRRVSPIDKQLLKLPNETKAMLLNNLNVNAANYTPTLFVLNEKPKEIIQPYERRMQIQYAYDQYAKNPLVNTTINNKNITAIGDAWLPIFVGTRKDNAADKQWADNVTSWLIHEYYPNCNFRGSNFTFRDTLFITAKDMDLGGGSMMIYTFNPVTKFPQVDLIPPDRIGNRVGEDMIIPNGAYKGCYMFDGQVYSPDNQLIAYKILGDTAENDYFVSTYNCQYNFSPQWTQYGHGVSKVSSALLNLKDILDTDEYEKLTQKNLSRYCVIMKNSRGVGTKGKRITQQELPPVAAKNQVKGETQNKLFYDEGPRSGVSYIASDSDLEAMKYDRPTTNVESFKFRKMSESVSAMGWDLNMVINDRLTGPGVRSIQDKCRKLTVWQQMALERRAKAIVQYGVAQGMKQGLIPKTDNPDWLRFSFTRPASLTIDNGYDSQSQIEALTMGISTKQDICSLRGKNWVEVSEQTDKELRDLFTRAEKLAKDFNISPAEAREWLSKRDIDTLQPQPAKNIQPETE